MGWLTTAYDLTVRTADPIFRGGVWSEAAERQQQQKTRRFPRPMMSARWKSSENLNLTTCHHNITTIGCVRMGAATFHSTLATMIIECCRLWLVESQSLYIHLYTMCTQLQEKHSLCGLEMTDTDFHTGLTVEISGPSSEFDAEATPFCLSSLLVN